MSRTVTTAIIVLLACAVSAGGEVNLEEGLLKLKLGLMGSTEKGDDASTSSSSSDAEWTYRRTATDGEEPYGPSDWYKGYPDCAGDSQSPINIAASIQTVTEPEVFGLTFFPYVCKSEDLVFEINEHSWEVYYNECSEESYLNFDGERYNMYQTHFHSPSEHAIGGSLHAAEMHMVHIKEGTDDEYLVVGVLFDVSEYGYNVELQPLWNVLRTGETSTDKTFGTSIYDILPSNPVYSYYVGSLTTPSCTEGVTWIVMNDPVIIGKLQLDEFRTSVATYNDSKVDEFGNTNRPYQPLNGRDVYLVNA